MLLMTQKSGGLVVRKSQPTQGDVHVNRPLTNISIAYLQATIAFVADRVFPNLPVTKQSDHYWIFPRAFFNRDSMKKRAPGTKAQKIGYKLSTDTYNADVWAARVDIEDQVRDNADDPLDLDSQASRMLSQHMLIKREVEWVSNFFTTSKWGTDVTGVVGTPADDTEFTRWSDYAASDPIKDIETGKIKVGLSGFEPNTLVCDRHTWGQLKDHPAIVDRLNRGQTAGPARATLDSVAAILELERILVSRATRNTAAEGASAVDAYIAGKNALLCHVPDNPGLMIPSAGYTFSWRGRAGAGPQGQRIKRFRVEEIESDVVEGQMAFDQKLTGSDLGYFFSGTVA